MADSYDEARAAFEALARSLERRIRSEQDRVLRIYAEAYLDIIGQIRRIYDRYADGDAGAITNADRTTMNRLKGIASRCADRLGLAEDRVQEILERDCRELYGESFFHIAYEVDRQVVQHGPAVSWGLVPDTAVEMAALDGYGLLARSDTFAHARTRSISKVQEIFAKGIIMGHSYERVRDALVKALGVEAVSGGAARYAGRGAAAWAMMVARTEMHRAFSLAQAKVEGICEEEDLDIDWIWLATLDGRTRPAHGALDGQKKDREHGGWYSPSVGWVKGPGLSGVAAFDINCRCTVMAIYGGQMPETRYERGKGEVPWKTYAEWAASFSKGVKVDLDLSAVETGTQEDLRRSVVGILTRRSALPSVDRLNGIFLSSGKARFITDGMMGGRPRAYCSGSTINIPSGIVKTSYGKETIAHEARHFLENTVIRTDAIDMAYDDFVSAMRRTLDVMDPRDSRWDRLLELLNAYPKRSCIDDLINIISSGRIAPHFTHDLSEIATDSQKASEILADLHSIATTEPKAYGVLQSVLDDLTDAFEGYTLLLGGK